MKLFYAQKDDSIVCLYCRTTLKRGEVYVRTGYKKGERWGFLFYHYDCYVEVVKEKLQRKYDKFRIDANKPVKRGRPSKYRDTEKAQRLMCLVNYHSKAGNKDRVEELGKKLKELGK